MKIFQSLLFVAVAIVSASVSAAEQPKQLYHITVPKTTLDAALATFGDELDIWEATPIGDGKVKADIYAEEATIAKFKPSRSILSTSDVVIQRDPVDTAALLAERAKIISGYTITTSGWLQNVPLAANYVDNAFFDRFRQPDEVFSFLDTLVAENPTLFSKIAKVTTTFEGRTVPGYKISTGAGRKSLYTQGLIHAREWNAGSSGYFAIATFLDGLRNGDATITSIFDEYDWYFVPILNLDGHLFTWSTNRLWRKNRRPTSATTFGVDLNRNYGPAEYFGLGGFQLTSETYPGTAVLSEPETKGSWAFLSSLPNLRGVIDLHSYGGLVLRPFGYQRAEAPAPYGPKLKTLGDNVRNAIVGNSSVSYVSQTGAELYLSYGTSRDAVYTLLNRTAVLTFETEGTSFVVADSVIRPSGRRIVQGLVQFVKELKAYYA